MKENTKKGSCYLNGLAIFFKHYFCYKHFYSGR